MKLNTDILCTLFIMTLGLIIFSISDAIQLNRIENKIDKVQKTLNSIELNAENEAQARAEFLIYLLENKNGNNTKE